MGHPRGPLTALHLLSINRSSIGRNSLPSKQFRRRVRVWTIAVRRRYFRKPPRRDARLNKQHTASSRTQGLAHEPLLFPLASLARPASRGTLCHGRLLAKSCSGHAPRPLAEANERRQLSRGL